MGICISRKTTSIAINSVVKYDKSEARFLLQYFVLSNASNVQPIRMNTGMMMVVEEFDNTLYISNTIMFEKFKTPF